MSKTSDATPLTERVVKEAVGVGLETPMRESILEAVDEAEGTGPKPRTIVPAMSAVLGTGVAIGYLLGKADETETESTLELDSSTEESEAETTEIDEEEPSSEGGGIGSKLLVVLGVLAGAALVWRRRQAEEEEWEPIEEFEPATDAVFGDEDEDEEEEELMDQDDEESETSSTESDTEEGADEAQATEE